MEVEVAEASAAVVAVAEHRTTTTAATPATAAVPHVDLRRVTWDPHLEEDRDSSRYGDNCGVGRGDDGGLGTLVRQ